MSEIHKYLEMISDGQHLETVDAGRVFQIIVAGGATPAQIAAVLMGLRMNTESIEEITGAAMAIRNKAKKLAVPEELKSEIVDTCGTGGDGKGTYNVSTAVAIVAAACGVPVVKHGNRAISSKSGSADVLMALGVNIDAEEKVMVKSLEEAGICFLMAPKYHTAMRHVAPIRQELGLRTMFNLIGPLVNPSFPRKQLVGVYSKRLVAPFANALKNLGSTRTWVVHGSDGMDEITTSGETYVAELKDGGINEFTINPEELGIEKPEKDALVGGDSQQNASAIHNLLKGSEGAYRDIVLLNTAATLVVSGKADDLNAGIAIAKEAIDSGKAKEKLLKFVEITNLPL